MKNHLILLIILIVAMITLPFLAFGSHKASVFDNRQTDIPNITEGVQVFGDGISQVSEIESESKKESYFPPFKEEYSMYHLDAFKILDKATGKVDEVSVLDYVIGAVMTEIPATYQVEAIKAQAVAAHTYALHHHLSQQKNPDPTLKGADFSADPSSHQGFMTAESAKKRFGDKYSDYYDKIAPAVKEVINQILVYDDEPIVAAYHAISAGQTEDASNVWNGSAEYLVPVDSKGDEYAPEYETIAAVSFDDLAKLMENKYPGTVFQDDPEKWLEIVSRSQSGYITEINVGDTSMSGLDFRNMLGLRSSNFDISFSGNGFAFVVKGYGHGVGMSQYGSDYMARQGALYNEILEHYYRDAVIVSIG